MASVPGLTEQEQQEVERWESLGEMGDAEMEKSCRAFYDAVLAGKGPAGWTEETVLEQMPVFAKRFRNEIPNIRVDSPGPDGKLFSLQGKETTLFGIVKQASSPLLLNLGSFT